MTSGAPIFLISAFLVQVPGMLGTAHILTFSGGGAFGLGVLVFIVNALKNINETTLISRKDKAL